MMNREEFLDLYEKKLNGTASAAEKQQLESYQDEMKLSDALWEDNNYTEQEVYAAIWKKLSRSRRRSFFAEKHIPQPWLRAAAVLLIVSLVCLVLIRRKPAPHFIAQHASPGAVKPVLPGSNKAMLTLANGTQIALTDARNGQLATEAGVRVSKTKEGLLVYQGGPAELKDGHAATNTITVPRGGQYQVVLGDGTQVWLNAASTLTYPATFSGRERRVQLSGEAYFEVRKNPAAPFIVQTSGQEIRVLGTHFNVNAYEESSTVKTSLLEGKVSISSSGKTVSLNPGQQATSRFGGSVTVAEADVSLSVAWKNGLFRFEDATVEDVLQQLGRWYDVQVVYTGKPPVKQFSGTVSRQVSLAEVLSMLSYTGIHLSLRQHTIVVMP